MHADKHTHTHTNSLTHSQSTHTQSTHTHNIHEHVIANTWVELTNIHTHISTQHHSHNCIITGAPTTPPVHNKRHHQLPSFSAFLSGTDTQEEVHMCLRLYVHVFVCTCASVCPLSVSMPTLSRQFSIVKLFLL
jgi:hypothetical protein